MKPIFSITVIVLVMSYSWLATAAEFGVYNPHSVKLNGVASIELNLLGIKDSEFKLIRVDNGRQVPYQIISKNGKKLLLTVLELKGLAGVKIQLRSGNGRQKALLKNSSTKESLIMDTPLYLLALNKQQGFTMNALTDKQGGKIPRITQAELIFSAGGEQQKYNGHLPKPEKLYYQSKSKVSGNFIYSGGLEAQLELSWPFEFGTVRDVVTFNGINRLIRHNVTLKYNKIMVQGEYRLALPHFSSSQGEGTVFPQQERYPEKTFNTPGYEFAYNPEKKYGIGLIAPPDQPLRNFFWEFLGKSEAVSFDKCRFSLFTKQLRYTNLPGTFNFSFALMAGGTPAEAADYAVAATDFREFKTISLMSSKNIVQSIKFSRLPLVGEQTVGTLNLFRGMNLGALKLAINNIAVKLHKTNSTFNWRPQHAGNNRVVVTLGKNRFFYNIQVKTLAKLTKLRLAKLVNKPNQVALATVTLINNAPVDKTFKLVSTVVSAIDNSEIVNSQTVTVSNLDSRKITIPWNSGSDKKGFTFAVKLFYNDKLVDSINEYGSVTAFVPDAGQYSVANPGWFKTPGQEKVFIKKLRNNYFGFFEFYAWTPCPMTGLSPKTEQWEPHTESQVAYRATISKSFVKKFIKLAHKNGIAVFAWMNGEVALPTGLTFPDTFRYSQTGQPLLYSGRIWDGKRFAIGYTSALYNADKAYLWGKAMAKSIDMFGWDGCRFDWAFTPSVVGDPMRAKKSDWYNSRGVSSRKLYPAPDAAGAKALKAFRKGVAETHPEFIYGTNSGKFSAEMARALPKYKKESSTDSWIWFEYLLGYYHKRMATWQKWSKVLTKDSQLARPNGAQIGLGRQRPYSAGATSAKLIPYLILYSGLHWIGPTDRNKSLGENWKIWRYAMRYSKYFYGKNFKLMPVQERLATIAVTASPRLFWQQWIFEKKDKNGRSLLVNMVNLPQGDYISERHELPQPQKNIVLTFNKRSNEKVKRVVMLNAMPEPHTVVLKATTAGNRISVAIPVIKWGTSILIETKE
ncbi:MAG: hypothetical protein L3J71_11495 [Victivallaceae bacterium]|nr:hypothetical protein [Victivallaceae bacterium]